MRVRTVFLVRCDIFKISSAPREMGRGGGTEIVKLTQKSTPPPKKIVRASDNNPPPPKRKNIYIYILGPKINASPSPEKKKTFSCQNFWA